MTRIPEGRHAEGNTFGQFDSLLLLVLKFITQCVLLQWFLKYFDDDS